jgi:dinuclear metal center YbgI/SA1388 family protein
MRLGEVVEVLDELAPPGSAEPWDNVGLLTGDLDSMVERALFAIDYTADVAREAEAAQAGVVIAYHPPIFEPVRRIASGSLIYRAIQKNVALYSPHTALDIATGGTNDVLGDVVGLVERRALRPRDPSDPTRGMGRVGLLKEPRPRSDLLAHIKADLGVDHALVAGPSDGDIRRVAVAAGSSGDLYKEAIAAGAELYLTGEMRHHDALACARAGMTVVCVLHSNSERKALRNYAERFATRATGLLITLSRVDRDPFTIV